MHPATKHKCIYRTHKRKLFTWTKTPVVRSCSDGHISLIAFADKSIHHVVEVIQSVNVMMGGIQELHRICSAPPRNFCLNTSFVREVLGNIVKFYPTSQIKILQSSTTSTYKNRALSILLVIHHSVIQKCKFLHYTLVQATTIIIDSGMKQHGPSQSLKAPFPYLSLFRLFTHMLLSAAHSTAGYKSSSMLSQRENQSDFLSQ